MTNYTTEYWQNLINIGRENKKEEIAKQVKLAPAKLDRSFLGWVEALETVIFHGQEHLSTYFIVPTELRDWAQEEIQKKAAGVGIKVTNESREDGMIRFTLSPACATT